MTCFEPNQVCYLNVLSMSSREPCAVVLIVIRLNTLSKKRCSAIVVDNLRIEVKCLELTLIHPWNTYACDAESATATRSTRSPTLIAMVICKRSQPASMRLLLPNQTVSNNLWCPVTLRESYIVKMWELRTIGCVPIFFKFRNIRDNGLDLYLLTKIPGITYQYNYAVVGKSHGNVYDDRVTYECICNLSVAISLHKNVAFRRTINQTQQFYNLSLW